MDVCIYIILKTGNISTKCQNGRERKRDGKISFPHVLQILGKLVSSVQLAAVVMYCLWKITCIFHFKSFPRFRRVFYFCEQKKRSCSFLRSMMRNSLALSSTCLIDILHSCFYTNSHSLDGFVLKMYICMWSCSVCVCIPSHCIDQVERFCIHRTLYLSRVEKWQR